MSEEDIQKKMKEMKNRAIENYRVLVKRENLSKDRFYDAMLREAAIKELKKRDE